MRRARSRSARRSLLYRMRTTARGYVLRGLLVLVPLGITAYAMILIYRLTAANMAWMVGYLPITLKGPAVVVLSVVFFLTMLYVIGLAAALVVGRRIIGLGEAVLRRIPLVKTVYSASKQVMDVLQPKDGPQTFQESVFVGFPSPQVRTLAFVTGRMHIEGRGDHYRIFVPTTPNPTSGYLELMPERFVEHTGMCVEDVVKGVMSAGILVPDELELVSPKRRTAVYSESALGADFSAETAQTAKRQSLWQFTKSIFRRRILSGFLILVPLAVTVFVIEFAYSLTAGRIEPLTRRLVEPLQAYLPADAVAVATPVISVMLLLIALYLTGYAATWVVGARMIRVGESILTRIPLITTIYGASKQIVEMLVKPGGSSFQEAVLVEFPYPGVLTAGFLVGKSVTTTGDVYYRVFVPTTPNITIGLLEFFSPANTFQCPLSVEDTIKMIVSGGLIAPESIPLIPLEEAVRLAERSA